MEKVILSDENYENLSKQIKEARGSLSTTLKARLENLLFKLQKPESELPNKKMSWEPGDESVRSEIANLRRALKNRVWSFPDGRDCILDIPLRDTYRVEVGLPPAENRFWMDHVMSKRDLDIAIYERLFFRYGNDTYIRDTTVNFDKDRDRLLANLPDTIRNSDEWSAFIKGLLPSRHYLSSGELVGAIAMQDFFSSSFPAFLKSPVKIKIQQPTSSLSGNDVVIAASRVGDPDLDGGPDELFSAEEHRIAICEKGKSPENFREDSTDLTFRTVHVLLSRRAHNDSVKTILQGSHGRAIEGVCKMQLASPDAMNRIVTAMNLEEKRLPHQFQIVFEVFLVYDQRLELSRTNEVKAIAWAVGKQLKAIAS